MNDEGIGIAGWLLADLVLVLAIVFLAFTPAALSGGSDDAEPAAAAEATPVAAPLILDIGCVEGEQAGRWTPVHCEPDLGGGEVSTYEWDADGGWARSLPAGDYFAASFADAGAVRLTVKNEVDKHSAEFFVRPSPAPTAEATVAAPLIRDLGCVRTEAEGRIDVRCEPDLGGGEASSYAWEADRGSARSSDRGPTFAASFTAAGAVRLTVANESGEHSDADPVLPPPTPTPPPVSANLVLEDFRFDQIVFCGALTNEVEWNQIAAARVREDVSKEEELSGEWCQGEGGGALAFLRAKQQEGFRIAMVETFSNLNNSTSTLLSARVNEEFYEGLSEAATGWLPLGSDLGDIFVDCSSGERWFAEYFDRSQLDQGEVRINIFFVRRSSDITCP